MDKTININLGGMLFQLDEAAYTKLKNYLNAINVRFRNTNGGNETIDDIENRIAEIFMSMKGTAGVINSENVDEMIGIMGKPEDFERPGFEKESGPSFSANPGPRKKLYKNPENHIIAGVCGGIGAYLNSDPVWIRILFVLFAFFFGIGFFVYLALWIVLPLASTDQQKHEMYGGDHNWAMPQEWDQHTGSRVGNAINEVFRAIGRVVYIIVRIILIVFGTSIVVTGFIGLLAYVLIFIFKYPGAFSADIQGMNLTYLPDFLNYMVSGGAAPWIRILLTIAVCLPLLALIYGGIRLIFWFRARDGFIWLGGILVWVLCVTALSIILFNEGVSFAKHSQTVTMDTLKLPADTIYVSAGAKLSGIKSADEISLPDDGGHGYNIFIMEDKKQIAIKSHLDFNISDDKSTSIRIVRHATGRDRIRAEQNADRLVYNYKVSADTLFLDEYFTLPEGARWSMDYVDVNLSIPVGTVVRVDKDILETIMGSGYRNREEFSYRNGLLVMTPSGLSVCPESRLKGN